MLQRRLKECHLAVYCHNLSSEIYKGQNSATTTQNAGTHDTIITVVNAI